MSVAHLVQMSGVVVDLVYRVEAVPKPGEEAHVEDSLISPGGGFNAMVAASRSGMDVSYGGSHGTGRFSDIVRSALSEFGFPVLQKRLETCDQGTSVVLVDAQGERTFISQHGAERYFGLSQFGQIDVSQFSFVLISGYTFAFGRNPPDMEDWLAAFPTGPKLIFDPSPVVDKVPAAMLALLITKSAWISANAEEAYIITGLKDPELSAAALVSKMGTTAHGALVRDGAEGCWLAQPGQPARFVPPYAVDAVDTNGAGDTHIGAFIAALGAGDDPVSAARFANAAAALSTLEKGPATAPLRQQTLAFMAAQADGANAADPFTGKDLLQSSNH